MFRCCGLKTDLLLEIYEILGSQQFWLKGLSCVNSSYCLPTGCREMIKRLASLMWIWYCCMLTTIDLQKQKFLQKFAYRVTFSRRPSTGVIKVVRVWPWGVLYLVLSDSGALHWAWIELHEIFLKRRDIHSTRWKILVLF